MTGIDIIEACNKYLIVSLFIQYSSNVNTLRMFCKYTNRLKDNNL